jgi:hypothetical protein
MGQVCQWLSRVWKGSLKGRNPTDHLRGLRRDSSLEENQVVWEKMALGRIIDELGQ